MRASFDDSGNLVLEPDNNLERMAAGHFVSALHRRNRPQVLVAGMTPVADPVTVADKGQPNLKDVV